MGRASQAYSQGPFGLRDRHGRRGPACSALTLCLPPASEDRLAQLLQVLQDLQEAHNCSPVSSLPLEPNYLLELQT